MDVMHITCKKYVTELIFHVYSHSDDLVDTSKMNQYDSLSRFRYTSLLLIIRIQHFSPNISVIFQTLNY